MNERYKSIIAVFLILTRENKGKTEILLQERYNTGYMDGKYDTACSGHLEPNESLSMALVREAKEEINLDIDEEDLEFVSLIHPYKEGYVNVFFTTKKYSGTPRIMEPDKCSNLQWFDIDNLPNNTIERIRNVIENMKKRILYDDGNFSHQKEIE